MLKKVKVLEKAEVLNIYEILNSLKGYWELRNEDEHPFELPRFTLGSASYIDAKSSYEKYRKKAEEFNPLLEKNLAALYEKVLSSLETALEKKCEYSCENALPGFHIFGSDIYFEEESGNFHHDRQDELIDWGDIQHNSANNLSFTLSIKLPKRGAGLILFSDQVKVDNAFKESEENVSLLKEVLLSSYSFQEAIETPCDLSDLVNDLEFIKYEEGYMFIHSGKFTHAMAPAIEMTKDDMRITLQGHGILDEAADKYLLYW